MVMHCVSDEPVGDALPAILTAASVGDAPLDEA